MNIVTRILALGALGAASLTQGCGCSSNNNNPTVVNPPPGDTPTVSISGAAVKGIVGGGVVSAFALDNKGVIAGQPFITSVTDALGKYTIKIPETYVGKPISFRITPAADNTTKLTCDLDIGCGTGVNFGNKYTLPSTSSLVLETIIPALDKTKNVNLSTFSTLAAAQAKKALLSTADLNAVMAAIRKANGEIANMFGLTGELSELELMDITDAAAVKAAVNGGKSEVLRIAALNAAIISASRSANPGFTLEQALTKLIADITAKGLASNSSDGSVADLTKILTAVSNILERVKILNASGVDLTALITSVANELGRVRNEPVDVYNTGVVLPDSALNDKAYAFADMVRQLVNGGDIVLNTSVGNNTTVKAKSDKLRAQWEAAQMLSGPNAEWLSKSLSTAAEAIAEADDAYNHNVTLKSYTVGDVTVAIKLAAPKVEYTVDQMIAGNTVKLWASKEYVEVTVGGVETTTGKLDLTGSAASSTTTVSVLSGSSLEVGKLTRENKNGVETSTLEGLKLTLKTEIAQIKGGNVTDPVTTAGTLKFEFASFERVKGSSNQEPVTKGVMAIGFDGTVKNTTGEAFAFALNIAGNTKGVTIDELSQGIDPTDTAITEEDFTSLTAAVSFTADLNTQLNSARVKLMTTREDLTTTRTSLDLIFGAYNLRFNALIKRVADQPYNLTITNQDRLSMTIGQTTVGGNYAGKITGPDGVKVLANIAQTDKDCVKVTIVEGGKFFCLIDMPE
ncbi:MAG TPA: hypothetical protein VIZ65_02625 [Cellvibrionaceae bacterium]